MLTEEQLSDQLVTYARSVDGDITVVWKIGPPDTPMEAGWPDELQVTSPDGRQAMSLRLEDGYATLAAVLRLGPEAGAERPPRRFRLRADGTTLKVCSTELY